MPPEELPNQSQPDSQRPSERISGEGLPPRPMQRPLMARPSQNVAVPPQAGYPNPAPVTPQPIPLPSSPPSPPPQPAATTPQAPVQTPTSPTAPPVPASSQPASEPKTFTPPVAKRKRRILRLILGIVAVLLAGAGIFAWLKIMAAENNPDKVLNDALQNSLQARQLETQTTAGNKSTQALYDFSNPTQPVISTQATFIMQGARFRGTGYGSLQNTYFSYTSLPSSVSGPVSSVVLNAWVQLRSKGELPAGASPTLSNLIDPRYQDIGPVVLGNYSQKTRQQLVNFLLAHVYSYQKSQVTKTTVAGSKVFAYPLKLDVGFLKIANESSAVSSGLGTADIQSAISALDAYKGASIMLYVDAKTHHVQEMTLTKGGQTTTITYGHYNNVTLPDEPATKLSWQEFAPIEAQIEAPKKQ